MAKIADRNFDIKDSSTVEEFVREGEKKTVTAYNYSIIAELDDIIMPMRNILDGYLDTISILYSTYEMTDLEFNKYYMRPDLFCYDKFGDYEYEFVILLINEMSSPKDFTKKKIKMIDASIINKVLSYIKTAEKEMLEFNREIYTKGLF